MTLTEEQSLTREQLLGMYLELLEYNEKLDREVSFLNDEISNLEDEVEYWRHQV